MATILKGAPVVAAMNERNAALCEQLTLQSRFFPAIRLAIGLRIAAVVVAAVCGAWRALNG